MGRLMHRTRELLIADPRSIPTIYKESGIPFYWLRKFHAGGYANPSVNKVERLYEFLTGEQLRLK